MFNYSIMAINYNSNFVTTYKSFSEEYYSDLCYKIQLLQAFNMMKYDEYILQQNIQKAYYFLRESDKIKKILNVLSKNNKQLEIFKTFSNDLSPETENMFYFQILFSYDYFDYFHKFLCVFLKTKNDLRENELNKVFEELLQFIIKIN